ncbi:hypothetical protein ACVWXL_005708 [Bradyrhizobium sp. GM22.5]
MLRRRRVQQTTTLQERLAEFTRTIREKAEALPDGKERDERDETAQKRRRGVKPRPSIRRQGLSWWSAEAEFAFSLSGVSCDTNSPDSRS